MQLKLVGAAIAGSLLTCGVASWAAETITYSYDARGRLISVSRSGSVNDGVVTNYELDNMSNRKTYKVTGSTNPPPSP